MQLRNGYGKSVTNILSLAVVGAATILSSLAHAASGISPAPKVGSVLTKISDISQALPDVNNAIFAYSKVETFPISLHGGSPEDSARLTFMIAGRDDIDSPTSSNVLILSRGDVGLTQVFILGPIDISSIRKIGDNLFQVEGSGGNAYGNFDSSSNENCRFSGVTRSLNIRVTPSPNDLNAKITYVKVSDKKWCDSQR